MKKAVRLIAVVFLICAAAPVAAAGQSQGRLSQNSDYSQYAYLLDGYDVKITVNEDNTFDITETIDAFFNVPKHGIIRKLPIRNEVERLDGTVSRNRVKITGLAVNEPYASSVSGGYREIKIGEEETTLTGAKQYRIRYNYNIGKDTGKDYDEFYFDIIGGEWDTAVGGVTFTIAMPKEFDQSKLGFSKGRTGSTDNSGIDYEVNGRVITGRYNGVLNAGEALTVRLELPEGYFTATSYNPDFMTVASFALPVLLALLAVLIWTKYGRDEKAVETVEFYPPAGFNSAEVGFLYKGKAEANDAVSLMIYLANKGYIGIEEFEERSLFAKNKAFKLTKLKEYDGDNANERLFLTGLFNTPRMPKLSDIAGMLRSKDSAPDWANEDGRTEVTSSDLRNTFYVTVNQIVKNLNAKQNRETVFEKSSLGKGFLVGLLILVVYALITVKPVLEYAGASALPFALLFPGIGFTVLCAMVFGKTKLPVKIFGLVWGFGFGGIPWATMVLPALTADPLYLAAYIVGLLCVAVMVVIFKLMPKRTAYGNELFGKIKGFKNFLELAEKPKLEELVFQDPAYFYNILPFTYVLGVSDKWIEKFESIAIQPPDWYTGHSAFSAAAFGSFMSSTMAAASSAMTSSPSSGGGSSGGGSSGGGSGGGGGSSW